jgi:hypothetical protein
MRWVRGLGLSFAASAGSPTSVPARGGESLATLDQRWGNSNSDDSAGSCGVTYHAAPQQTGEEPGLVDPK